MPRFIASAAVLLILTMVAACGAEEDAGYSFPFTPGVELKVKAFGHYFYSEAIKADGPYVTWKLRWNDRVVSVRKDYKGLITVYESELENNFINEFETASIDELFPLKVGNETSFKGYRITKEDGTEVPFWVHMVVVEEDVTKVRDTEYKTLVVETTTEYERPDETLTVIRRLWFAPELGFSLKSEYRSGSELFQTHVLSIIKPEEEDPEGNRRRRTLGTVRI